MSSWEVFAYNLEGDDEIGWEVIGTEPAGKIFSGETHDDLRAQAENLWGDYLMFNYDGVDMPDDVLYLEHQSGKPALQLRLVR